jgi:YEATS domain-containing protein 4
MICPTSSRRSLSNFTKLIPIPYEVSLQTERLRREAEALSKGCDKPPYEVTETGWGEFEIQVKIFFVPEANEKPLTFVHHLKLHPWPLTVHTGPNNMTPGNAEDDAEGEQDTEMQDGQKVEGGSREPSAMVPDSQPATRENSAVPPPVQQPPPQASTSAEAASQPAPTDSNGMDVDAPSEPDPAASASATTVPPAPVSNVSSTLPSQIILTPVRSWQYDEIVFTEPTEAFFKLLIATPPTPL